MPPYHLLISILRYLYSFVSLLNLIVVYLVADGLFQLQVGGHSPFDRRPNFGILYRRDRFFDVGFFRFVEFLEYDALDFHAIAFLVGMVVLVVSPGNKDFELLDVLAEQL